MGKILMKLWIKLFQYKLLWMIYQSEYIISFIFNWLIKVYKLERLLYCSSYELINN